MRLYRLLNLTQHGPAAGLYFLKREGADRYKDLVKWPYANEGRWPLPGGGDLPLDALDLRVEALERAVLVEPVLGLAVFELNGQLGGAPFLPGDCYDPDEWMPASPADLAHPVNGPRWEEALRQLRHPQ